MIPHHHYHLSLPLCTRAHQIGALELVAVTFILTRSLDRLSSFSSSTSSLYSSSHFSSDQFHAGALNWPERGYGSDIKLRIYVYDESKIDGLQELMRGRDGQITPRPASRDNGALRTTKKDEADFLFVPSYVNCVRTLNDKEVNQTCVKVLSQMPYFRGSGGRDHIFIFPSGVGPHLFRSWATYLNRSVILTPEVWEPRRPASKQSYATPMQWKNTAYNFGDCFEASMNWEKFPEKGQCKAHGAVPGGRLPGRNLAIRRYRQQPHQAKVIGCYIEQYFELKYKTHKKDILTWWCRFYFCD